MQRKTTKPGKGLGKTSGWVHRASMKMGGVKILTGVQYDKIDDQGLHITMDGQSQCLDVDHVVVCAGQVSVNQLFEPLKASGRSVHIIGGAKLAAEVDAKRAIQEGTLIAAAL